MESRRQADKLNRRSPELCQRGGEFREIVIGGKYAMCIMQRFAGLQLILRVSPTKVGEGWRGAEATAPSPVVLTADDWGLPLSP